MKESLKFQSKTDITAGGYISTHLVFPCVRSQTNLSTSNLGYTSNNVSANLTKTRGLHFIFMSVSLSQRVFLCIEPFHEVRIRDRIFRHFSRSFGGKASFCLMGFSEILLKYSVQRGSTNPIFWFEPPILESEEKVGFYDFFIITHGDFKILLKCFLISSYMETK